MTAHLIARTQRVLAAFLGTMALAVSVQAAPVFLLDATTDGQAPDRSSFSNVAFSLTFEDLDGDQAFGLTELLAFSGLSDSGGQYFDQLLQAPRVAGVAGSGDQWLFGDSQGVLAPLNVDASRYTAFISSAADDNTVPEPSSLALVVAAWAAAAWLRRRHR